MRLVLDTNVLVAALISPAAPPHRLYEAWRERRFDLVSCALQLEELRRVSRYPKLATRVAPHLVGRVINELRLLTLWIEVLPTIERSPDPYDNFLLALAEAGEADFLVSGDKRGVLALGSHGRARIVTASAMVDLLS